MAQVLMVTLYIYLAHVTISKGIKIFKKELQARKDKGGKNPHRSCPPPVP